jgi:hypothetical protein
MDIGVHTISSGERYRECVEITKSGEKKSSRTFHQEKVNGEWVKRLPRKKKSKRSDDA